MSRLYPSQNAYVDHPAGIPDRVYDRRFVDQTTLLPQQNPLAGPQLVAVPGLGYYGDDDVPADQLLGATLPPELSKGKLLLGLAAVIGAAWWLAR